MGLRGSSQCFNTILYAFSPAAQACHLPVLACKSTQRSLGGSGCSSTTALINRAIAGARLSFGRLEQLDWITIEIFQLNLSAARTNFHLIAEAHSLVLEILNACGQ